MTSNTIPRLRIRLLTITAALCAAAIVGLYVHHVGRASSFKISSDGAKWAEFAGYLAGTLGPALSFLAFIAVLWTVSLQREQLELVREGRVLEEMQRLLSSLYESIQNRLREDVSNRFKSDYFRQRGLNLNMALIACGEMVSQRERPDSQTPPDSSELTLIAEARKVMATPAVSLIHELTHFTLALDKYRALGGSGDVTSFYVRRFSHVVRSLQLLNFTKLPPRTAELFLPDDD